MKVGEKGLKPSEAVAVALEMMKHSIVPMGTKIIITRDPAPDEINGIIVPDQAKGDMLNGTVLAVGEMVEEDLRPGDRISFTKYNPVKYEIPVGDLDVTVLVVSPSDIYIRWRPYLNKEMLEEEALNANFEAELADDPDDDFGSVGGSLDGVFD